MLTFRVVVLLAYIQFYLTETIELSVINYVFKLNEGNCDKLKSRNRLKSRISLND